MFTPKWSISRRGSHTVFMMCCICTHLPAGCIHGLLGGGIGVDCGHESLNNAILVIDHLCQRSKAVCGTGGVAREKETTRSDRKGWYKFINVCIAPFTPTICCKKTCYIQGTST